jgi:SAM-dependent methyltransferase
MAGSYNEQEPHFRPENQEKVRSILSDLRKKCGGGKLLDVGCGTGFIINLAKDLFDEIHGVDVTQAMMDRIDVSSGKIKLHRAPAESVPFPDATFNMVTAYSFLHHTEDYRKVLAEGYRVLKPGGIFYVDLEPNKLFWDTMTKLAQNGASSLPPMVAKARDSVVATDDRVQQEFGIPQDVFNLAEYGKDIQGGIDVREASEAARSIGFREQKMRFEWYVGQAEVMHGQSFEDAKKIETFLRNISPLSDHLFKYLQFILVK